MACLTQAVFVREVLQVVWRHHQHPGHFLFYFGISGDTIWFELALCTWPLNGCKNAGLAQDTLHRRPCLCCLCLFSPVQRTLRTPCGKVESMLTQGYIPMFEYAMNPVSVVWTAVIAHLWSEVHLFQGGDYCSEQGLQYPGRSPKASFGSAVVKRSCSSRQRFIFSVVWWVPSHLHLKSGYISSELSFFVCPWGALWAKQTPTCRAHQSQGLVLSSSHSSEHGSCFKRCTTWSQWYSFHIRCLWCHLALF